MMNVKVKKMRNMAMLLAASLLSLSCGQGGDSRGWSKARTEMEAAGQTLLSEARAALAVRQFDKARAIVEQMRKECTLALDAREEGILLMDSIDLSQARSQLQRTDSLQLEHPADSHLLQQTIEDLNQKVKFYKRKLEHDKQNRRQH